MFRMSDLLYVALVGLEAIIRIALRFCPRH